ncbi:MAG: DUF58 domain-containing protein [Anaerolineae bacterium]
MSRPLFDEAFMRRLERLSLIARRVRAGRSQGERRSTKRGVSVEFADYRNYAPGDDLRHLDWHIYARLERPFIKLFEEEEEQAVHLLLDASASMDWPESDPERNKWNYGRKLAAALGYIALAGGDRLTLAYLGRAGHRRWGPHRGRGRIHLLLDRLSEQTAAGPTDLNATLRGFAGYGSGRAARTGLVFLISDFFSPNGYERGLAALLGAGHEINVLHLLSPDEVDPALAGDLRLHDLETGLSQDITIDPAMRRLYRQRFVAWREALERYCFSRGINYVTLNTALAFETVMLDHLRRRGFVR